MALPRDARESLSTLKRRLGATPRRTSGASTSSSRKPHPFLDFLYQRWWRVQVTGVATCPAMAARCSSNHAGIFPWDATMIGTAILREHPLPRFTRFLVLNWAFELPYVSLALRKVGGVPASPYNAMRLLEQDELVGVFPEGVKGTARTSPSATGSSASVAAASSSWPAHRLADHPGRRRGQRGDLPEDRRGAAARQAQRRAVLPDHAHVPAARAARARAAAVEVADRVLRADPDRPLRPRRRRGPVARVRAVGQVRATIQDKVYENLVKRGSAFV